MRGARGVKVGDDESESVANRSATLSFAVAIAFWNTARPRRDVPRGKGGRGVAWNAFIGYRSGQQVAEL